MSKSNGFAISRPGGSNRFYSPPVIRRNQEQQQQHVQRELKPESVEPDSEERALRRPNSVGSSLSPRPANLNNLDRLLASLTPFVIAQLSPPEPGMKGQRTSESDGAPYFILEDVWESFREWSAYGVEVPLILNGGESIKQYYVPYLSAIQLYARSNKSKRLSEDNNAETSKQTSIADSNDNEADKRARGGNLMNINSQRLSGLTLKERTTSSPSSDETEDCNSTGHLVYEYLEGDQPHFRPPFHDKISTLASKFPYLKKYRSCDLSPCSWFSVAWYPIYRIPVGSTLTSFDASFLTFYSLSAHSRNKNQNACSGRKIHGVDGSVNISLPVFALAYYKLRGSILTPNGASEWQQVNSLLQAANDWLQNLQVNHPDYQYFVSRCTLCR